MEIHRRPLSQSERKELEGFISPKAKLGRAVLFIALVGLFSILGRTLNRATPQILWWPFMVALAATLIFFAAKRLTGGADLRKRISKDLCDGDAEDWIFNLRTAVSFSEVEDEGPIWFFPDGAKTYCLAGQRVARLSTDGLPRRRIIVSIAPTSERILHLKAAGGSLDVLISPVPFFKSAFFSPEYLAKGLTEVPVDWEKIVSSISRGDANTPNYWLLRTGGEEAIEHKGKRGGPQ